MLGNSYSWVYKKKEKRGAKDFKTMIQNNLFPSPIIYEKYIFANLYKILYLFREEFNTLRNLISYCKPEIQVIFVILQSIFP